MRTGFALALLAVLTGCSAYLPRYPAPAGALETGFYADRAQPQYALLEYGIAYHLAREERPYETICAAGRNMQPHIASSRPEPLPAAIEAKLLARFPALSPLSRCVRSGVGFVDAQTQRPATVFDAHEIACTTMDSCTGWAGSLAGGWRYYALDWKGGEWRIRPEKLNDIVLTGEGR